MIHKMTEAPVNRQFRLHFDDRYLKFIPLEAQHWLFVDQLKTE